MLKAENKEIELPAKKPTAWWLPLELGRGKGGSAQSYGGQGPANTSLWTFFLGNTEKINFYYFKLPKIKEADYGSQNFALYIQYSFEYYSQLFFFKFPVVVKVTPVFIIDKLWNLSVKLQQKSISDKTKDSYLFIYF